MGSAGSADKKLTKNDIAFIGQCLFLLNEVCYNPKKSRKEVEYL